jgi:hypothetical protein
MDMASIVRPITTASSSSKDLRYSEMDWNTLELQAHRNWNEATMGPWD